MAIQKITAGITGQQAADIIYNNDIENANNIGIDSKDFPGTVTNLISPVKIVEGYVLSTGDIDTGAGSTAGWLRTKQIPVTPGIAYQFAATNFITGKKWVFFTAAGASLGNNTITTNPFTVTAPASAAYCILNVKAPDDVNTPSDVRLTPQTGTNSFTNYAGGKQIAASLMIDNQNNRDMVRKFVLENIASRSGSGSTKNKLNEEEIVEGYVRSNGVLDTGVGAITGWLRTGRVLVNPNTTYTFSAQSGFNAASGSKNICAYDSGNNFLSFVAAVSTNPFTFTTPVGTANIVMNLKMPTDSTPAQIMIEQGSVATAYVPFEYVELLSIYGFYVPEGGVAPGVTVTNKTNRYPNIYRQLTGFLGKALYTTAGQDPVKIVLLGDSLLARATHTSVNGIDPSAMPPTFVTKNFGAYLFNDIKLAKPEYSRYDRGRFTEVGAWATAENLSIWDDAGDIDTRTRRSTAANCSFAFTVAAGYTLFNVIDRTDTEGTTAATIGISGGNGFVEVKLEGGTWQEANNFVLSQRNTAPNAGAGLGNTQYQRRVYFRKVGSGIGSAQTITVTKDNTGDALMYWGIEEVQGDKPYVQLIDVARGGHTIDMLKPYVMSDVVNRAPNLVIFEVPLLNMIATNNTLAYNVNAVWDFLYGDRPGAANTNALKVLSNDWADFEVLVVIPHHSRVHFNSDSTFAVQSSGYTAQDLYNAVKGLIVSRGDLSYVDVSSAMLNAIDLDPAFNGNYYAALASSGITGNGYLNDGVHANDKGTRVWADDINPVFAFNTI